eukprot:2159634-Pyramimonas_sp.AAC.1
MKTARKVERMTTYGGVTTRATADVGVRSDADVGVRSGADVEEGLAPTTGCVSGCAVYVKGGTGFIVSLHRLPATVIFGTAAWGVGPDIQMLPQDKLDCSS